jgi:hypothetical protein
MRNEDQIKERIRMALVEDMNTLPTVLKEPENQLPQFLDKLTNHLFEITMDEIIYRNRY